MGLGGKGEEKEIKGIGKRTLTGKIKRVVVKIGSGVLSAEDNTRIDDKIISSIVEQVAHLQKTGFEILLVSSGAVATGVQELKLNRIPPDISGKQAAAAVGQSYLIAKYERLFKKKECIIAQILLTHGDMSDRRRYLNARTTLMILIGSKVVPIINENDTVAVDEIRFGDNDTLAAMAADIVEADLMIILSDVKGLYSENPKKNPNAEIIRQVNKISRKIEKAAGLSHSVWGSGGMKTKVQAAKMCVRAGIPVMIVDGKEPDIIKKAVSGEQVGTFFKPSENILGARKRWITHTLKVKGKIYMDRGAQKAILEDKKSLLPAGVTRVDGNFNRGDVVSCINSSEQELARGLVNYSAKALNRIMGFHTSKIEERLGYKMGNEAIHRDNMVIMKEENA